MAGEEVRLAALETAVGANLPFEYRTFLLSHVEVGERGQLVSGRGDRFDVRTIFELGDGPAWAQADEVHRLVGDVIPPGRVAVADDGGGNLYLLDCREGEEAGRVLWWDHEQETGEDRVEIVSACFRDFLGALVPDPEA